ncbi:MAG TPA: tetratricopeptide repeat protein [Flavobacteriales bacterium]|nr:tetratricopeptide repeat protein [Flavobacteriales bacterium]HMR28470.1 tetratricopeptide repeat protein [Flavobacteriales bacterium]
MRPAFLLCTALLSSAPSAAQIDLDSLWGVWHDTAHPPVDRLRAMSYISIDGFLYSDPDSAAVLAGMQYDLAVRHGNARYQGIATTTLGEYHMMKGDYARALERFTQAQRAFAEADEPVAQAKSISNMGVLLQELGDTDKALDLYRQSLALARAIPDTGSICAALINIGTLELAGGDTAAAAANYELCLRLSAGNPDQRDAAIAASDLGIIRSAQGERAEALRLHQQCLDRARAGGHQDLEAMALNNIGSHHLRVGELDLAERYGREALALARAAGFTKQESEVSGLLFNVYKQQGRSTEALKLLERKLALQDSLRSEDGRKELLRFGYEKRALADSLSFAAELAQAEDRRTIAELRAERNRNRAWAAAGAGVLLLGGLAAWSWTDRRRRRERFEKEAAHLETQALRSQMNPHFIFNALNSISAFVQGHDPDKATRFLSRFARVMRAVLENSRRSEVPLQDDLEALRGYMELERMRMDGRFDLRIEVDPAIDAQEVLVPPLVVQPFVENAIWHGMAGKEAGGLITLKVERRGDRLVYIVEDNGMGRMARREHQANEPPAKKTSLGTTITRARLDLVAKQHGRPAGFRTIDLPQGTRVEVELPLLLAHD